MPTKFEEILRTLLITVPSVQPVQPVPSNSGASRPRSVGAESLDPRREIVGFGLG